MTNNNYGTVTYNGNDYTLTQDAYVCGGSVRNGLAELTEWYEASAVDADGNECTVIWDISDNYDRDCGDESGACDWDNPWCIK